MVALILLIARSHEEAPFEYKFSAFFCRLSVELLMSSESFRRWFGDSMATVDGEPGSRPRVMYHASYRDVHEFDRKASSRWRSQSMDTVGVWFSDNPSEDGGAGMYASGPGAAIYPVLLRIERPKVYHSFQDFLRDMHEANGHAVPDSAPGRGSPEALREKLIAQGYDGIAFMPSNQAELTVEMDSLQRAVAANRREMYERLEELRKLFEGDSAGRRAAQADERLAYEAKEKRLQERLAALHAEEKATSQGSTEFDKQFVWVAFEPTQIKSAIGNSGRFNPESPSLTDHEEFDAEEDRPRERMAA